MGMIAGHCKSCGVSLLVEETLMHLPGATRCAVCNAETSFGFDIQLQFLYYGKGVVHHLDTARRVYDRELLDQISWRLDPADWDAAKTSDPLLISELFRVDSVHTDARTGEFLFHLCHTSSGISVNDLTILDYVFEKYHIELMEMAYAKER